MLQNFLLKLLDCKTEISCLFQNAELNLTDLHMRQFPLITPRTVGKPSVFMNNRFFIPEGKKMLIVALKPYVIVFCN